MQPSLHMVQRVQEKLIRKLGTHFMFLYKYTQYDGAR